MGILVPSTNFILVSPTVFISFHHSNLLKAKKGLTIDLSTVFCLHTYLD